MSDFIRGLTLVLLSCLAAAGLLGAVSHALVMQWAFSLLLAAGSVVCLAMFVFICNREKKSGRKPKASDRISS